MTYHNHRFTSWADDKAQKRYSSPDVNKPVIGALMYLAGMALAFLGALIFGMWG